MSKETPFEKSNELKRTFNELAEKWCLRNRLGLADLAERCGVSQQYLAHIGRYGRIPSKPILTLLAFNLEVEDPQALFRMAGVREPWPYDNSIKLRPAASTDSGLLSVNLDMKGFTSVIREIVRAEVQPKRLEELLGNRPLRIGLNKAQFFLFEEKISSQYEGFFPELMRSLALALHCNIEFVDVPHFEFAEKLASGAIDCFGPVYRTAPRLAHAIYAKPFCLVPVSGIGRVKKSASLADIPAPKRLSDLRKKDYVIAVHADSMAHHFAETVLAIPTSRIVTCDVPDEALERVLLSKLPRPAHLMLTDLPFAVRSHKEHSASTVLLFEKSDPDFFQFEDTIAIRSDWPMVLPIVDQALEFLRRGGVLQRLFAQTSDEYNIDLLDR